MKGCERVWLSEIRSRWQGCAYLHEVAEVDDEMSVRG